MTALYENLLLRLATILELSQHGQGTLDPQTKQALVQSTKDFKDGVREAREYATELPGGELSAEEQDAVIGMLQKLKDRKKRQLAEFAQNANLKPAALNIIKMEVDSTASTPGF
ncbi:hypothetical protein A0H81_00285 [Grifola frondosa]|uniref:Mediator of RNA polymerase II transcription subunit 9 n=1 Tax=Grifola frondosa TaxID=5627 RepID=A0A1C7MQF3_GRIFR|nr:hypothetical protein A0H81_00285 [Grifola frondosa]